MTAINDFVATHRFALKVLEAGGWDCEAYRIWLEVFHGRERLDMLEAAEVLLPGDSRVQEYAELLLDQMNELLADGCSEELLLATYEYCDRLYEMVLDAVDVAMGDASISESADNSNYANAA